MKTVCKVTLFLLIFSVFTSCNPEEEEEYRFDENDQPANVSTQPLFNSSIYLGQKCSV